VAVRAQRRQAGAASRAKPTNAGQYVSIALIRIKPLQIMLHCLLDENLLV
jgi:hypothetical protein